MERAKHVLVVDDDHVFRDVEKQILTGAGFATEEADSGAAAITRLKDAPGPDILAAIRTVHAGQPSLPAAIANAVVDRLRQPDLTTREVEVLKLIARGYSNKRIAGEIGVSASTVKNHIASLMTKLGADDRAHAVTLALGRNILDLDSLK